MFYPGTAPTRANMAVWPTPEMFPRRPVPSEGEPGEGFFILDTEGHSILAADGSGIPVTGH
jgi:hypothetical protein